MADMDVGHGSRSARSWPEQDELYMHLTHKYRLGSMQQIRPLSDALRIAAGGPATVAKRR